MDQREEKRTTRKRGRQRGMEGRGVEKMSAAAHASATAQVGTRDACSCAWQGWCKRALAPKAQMDAVVLLMKVL